MNEEKNKEWLDEPIKLGIIPGEQTDDASDIAYWQNIYELRKAPNICIQNRFFLSALKLMYCGIDNLAWLNRKHDRPNVKPKDFLDFVNEFLLADSELGLNANELYSARCGLLHCNIAESNISRSGKARILCYKSGSSLKEEDYTHVRGESHNRIVLVRIEDLYKAYSVSIDRLNYRIATDTNLSTLIYSHSSSLYAIIV